jgi:hypothetical protein
MKNDKYKPPMPPDYDNPSHVPHFPDWPNVPYADWPRTRFHRWNDSEPANVQPWWQDCCEPYDNPCVCVTSADVDLWNSYSGLSGLTAFDPETISAAVSSYSSISAQLEQFSGWDDLKYGYDVLSANSGMWNSAGYIPNIYENLSALASGKLDVTASRVWTDSLKLSHEAGIFGDFSGTIVGDGTYERPLRVSKEIAKAIGIIDDATNGFQTGLVNTDTFIKEINNFSAMYYQAVKAANEVSGNRELIEWILNHLHGKDSSANWIHSAVSIEASRKNPMYFYYWEEE